MEKQSKIWLEQAEKDLNASKNSIASENYEWASFQSHQAVEKALKYVYIDKFKSMLKTHDLVLLAKKVLAPIKILENCSKINPSYLDARYPDVPKNYNKEDAEEIFALAEEVVEWIKKN